MPNSPTLELAMQLIRCPSVTPEDQGCQKIMIERLERLGFSIHHINSNGVTNFWAKKGHSQPLIVFAGHTDVVPPGPTEQWKYPPFEATIEGEYLFGRGAADMKGSLAAMVVSVEEFIRANPNFNGSIGFLITSDEEGPATDGTIKVVDYLLEQQEVVNYCIVGEPSSTKRLGDIIKNGRRGSLNAHLTVKGIQGHVAYPHLANNPIHNIAPAITELSSHIWDQGNDFFPATTFQISNIHSGSGAANVIPGEVDILFNFRFNTEQTPEKLKLHTETVLKNHDIAFDIQWAVSGMPFLTEPGELVDACKQAIHNITGYETQLSTSGGTSDGRFIAKTGAQIVELGPLNKTIHQTNECTHIEELEKLTTIYQEVLTKLLL